MTFVTAEPEALASAAASMTGIGASMSAANASAAGPSTAVLPPATDPVSIQTVATLLTHTEAFHAIQAQAAQVHAQIAATFASGAFAYTEAEAANVAAAH